MSEPAGEPESAPEREPETIQLLRQWHNGEGEALETLVRRNLDWLRVHVRARVGPKLRAEGETQDFVQEAIVDVLTYGPRFEVANEAHFRALLGRIVENNLRDKNRYLGRQRRDRERVSALPSDTVLRLDPPVRSPTQPAEATERREREEWVRLAIELLDAPDRDVIWLREWESLAFEVIGERLGISENAARMRHRHALPRLARRVRELRSGRLADAITALRED